MNFGSRLYTLTAFLSAFLMFQVQPLMAKAIVPRFGGSAAVWGACLLFFQTGLLLGYLYAHWLAVSVRPRALAWIHSGVLAASLAALAWAGWWFPLGIAAGDSPFLAILAILAAAVGLPYLAISSTAPLLQWWSTRESGSAFPYRLYAWSNLGSMLGLVSYPLLIEPALTLRQQAGLWAGLYVLFALACGWLSRRARLHRGADVGAPQPATPPPAAAKLLEWAGLAFCPSLLLVAITSFMTNRIAPVPLLWVAPLTVYVLSFIIVFAFPALYRRTWFALPVLLAIGFLPYDQATGLYVLVVPTALAIYLLFLFAAALLFHGELVSQRPAPDHLTAFYLMMSLGGALGGLCGGVLPALVFRTQAELPLGLILTALAAAGILLRNLKLRWFPYRGAAVLGGAIAVLILIAHGVVYLRVARSTAYRPLRNFYGMLEVDELGAGVNRYRVLYHGLTIHGLQFLDPARRTLPTTYYSPDSGVAQSIAAKRGAGPLRVGMIGLGTGTLAAYGRPGDVFRFYELNPQVQQVAETEFSYLRDSQAKIEVILGDARLSLERENAQGYDLLVVDAFSGDAIPVHLITREAIALYYKHLKPDGMLVIHVTNQSFNLLPVVYSAARAFDKHTFVIEAPENNAKVSYYSVYAILTADEPRAWEQYNARLRPDFAREVPWTDAKNSVVSIIKGTWLGR